MAADIGRRQQQIMDVIHQAGEASVTEVRERLADPPSYSSVRTMLRYLEGKGLLRHREEGAKYIYRAVQSHSVASRSAVKRLLKTFFGDAPGDAVAAILDLSGRKLDDSQIERIQALIDQAKQEGK